MNMLRCYIAPFGLLTGMVLSAPLAAAQFCVDSANSLQAAIITGQFLNEFVEIRVVQGNYSLPGGLGGQYADVRYTNNLTISGGWTAGCNTRSMNPALTTINGQNHANSGWEINSSASITIEGLRLFQMQRLRLGNRFVPACQPGASINVRRTMIQNAGDTQLGALNIWGNCHQTRVENNLITGAAGNGIYYYCTGDSSPPVYRFVNNTVRNVGNWAFIAIPPVGGSCGGPLNFSNALYNNIFSFTRIVDHSPVVQSNIYSSLILDAGGTIAPGSGNNLIVDPQLDANYRPITPGSPAINSGTANVPGGLPGTDIEGTNRAIGTAPDRGAYESNVNDLFLISVTNNNDAGAGSLRAAIVQANSSAGLKSIQFDIPGTCPRVISLATPLPNITSPLIINGWSQNGSSTNTLENGNNATLCIGIRRGATTPAADVPRALSVAATSTATLTVRGIAFGGFSDGGGFVGPSAILLQGGSGHRIQGNQFGGQFGGTTLPASSAAIRIGGNAANALVGGPSPSQRNTIGANTAAGIVISGDGGNEIINNYIGTNPAGLSAVANQDGVQIIQSPGNFVLDNLISGNTRDGVLIIGENAKQNRVAGNLIGGRRGGLFICGVDPFPACPPPMTNRKGIMIDSGANDNRIGAVGSTGSPNRITNSTQHAVRVVSGQRNRIWGNQTYNNGTIEPDIDLGAFGVNPNGNDCAVVAPDLANRSQNYPLLQSAEGSGKAGSVTGQLTSCAGGNFTFHRIQFFASDSCGSTGHGPGQHFLGERFVAIPAASGNQATSSFTAPVEHPWVNLVGKYITATATDWNGNTSEYSACIQMQQADVIFSDRFQAP